MQNLQILVQYMYCTCMRVSVVGKKIVCVYTPCVVPEEQS